MKKVTASFAAFTTLLSVDALACPFCHTDTARQVREGILSSDFAFHLSAALAPFPVLALIVAFIHYGPQK